MFTYHTKGQFHLSCSLRLVSVFLNVGNVEISRGLLPTRFKTVLLSKKVVFQVQFWKKITCIIRKLLKN